MIWNGYYLLIILLFFILFIGGILYHVDKKNDLHMSIILNRIFFTMILFKTILLYVLLTNGFNLCQISRNIFCA